MESGGVMSVGTSGSVEGGCEVDCVIGVGPDKVFAVLADGWLYPLWVVGATHMREVDAHWPAAGARLHHKVGVWPLVLDDITEVEQVEPGRRLVLRAQGGPAGSARIEIELEPVAEGTRVRMTERAISGVGRLVPRPLENAMLRPRNIESLRRLKAIAENRG
jgi:uncharacterized protein YndB with AHSA1/START domain